MRYPKTLSVLVFAVAALVTGCSSAGIAQGVVPVVVPGDPVAASFIPDWFRNFGDVAVSDGDMVQGIGSGESTSLRIARGLARTEGTAEIVAWMGQNLGGNAESLDQMMGSDTELVETYRAARRVVMDEDISGVRQINSEILRDAAGKYFVYVMMEQDSGAQVAQIMAEMAKAREEYAKFQHTEAFKNLDEQLERYRERRRSPGR